MISLNLIVPIQFNMTEIKNTLRRMKPNEGWLVIGSYLFFDV